MNPVKLEREIKRLGFNQSSFARFIDVEPRQVRRWIADDAPMPHSVALLLRAMRIGELTEEDLQ